jgi:hypothetical protein
MLIPHVLLAKPVSLITILRKSYHYTKGSVISKT